LERNALARLFLAPFADGKALGLSDRNKRNFGPGPFIR
jgi:hypothetical protein